MTVAKRPHLNLYGTEKPARLPDETPPRQREVRGARDDETMLGLCLVARCAYREAGRPNDLHVILHETGLCSAHCPAMADPGSCADCPAWLDERGDEYGDDDWDD